MPSVDLPFEVYDNDNKVILTARKVNGKFTVISRRPMGPSGEGPVKTPVKDSPTVETHEDPPQRAPSRRAPSPRAPSESSGSSYYTYTYDEEEDSQGSHTSRSSVRSHVSTRSSTNSANSSPRGSPFDVTIRTDGKGIPQILSINRKGLIEGLTLPKTSRSSIPEIETRADTSVGAQVTMCLGEDNSTTTLRMHNPVIQMSQITSQITPKGKEYVASPFDKPLFDIEYAADELIVRNFFQNELKDIANSDGFLKEIRELSSYQFKTGDLTFSITHDNNVLQLLTTKKCGRHTNALRALSVILAAQNGCEEAKVCVNIARHMFLHISSAFSAYTACFLYSVTLSALCRTLCLFTNIPEKNLDWNYARDGAVTDIKNTGLPVRESFITGFRNAVDKFKDLKLDLSIPIYSHKVDACYLSYVFPESWMPYATKLFNPKEPLMVDNVSASTFIAYLRPTRPFNILKILMLPSIISRQM